MNKVVQCLVIAGFLGISASPVLAASQVLGHVQNCSTNIPYASVQATCGSQTKTVQTGSTGGDLGKYSITFNNATCTNGSTVQVTSLGKSNSGIIGTYFWFWDIASVDIQTGTNCESPSVPEFGLISGLIALSASAGSFVFLKKKK